MTLYVLIYGTILTKLEYNHWLNKAITLFDRAWDKVSLTKCRYGAWCIHPQQKMPTAFNLSSREALEMQKIVTPRISQEKSEVLC